MDLVRNKTLYPGKFWWVLDACISLSHVLIIPIIIFPIFLVAFLVSIYYSFYSLVDPRKKTTIGTLLYDWYTIPI